MNEFFKYIMSDEFEKDIARMIIPFCYVVGAIYLIRVAIFLLNFLTN